MTPVRIGVVGVGALALRGIAADDVAGVLSMEDSNKR